MSEPLHDSFKTDSHRQLVWLLFVIYLLWIIWAHLLFSFVSKQLH